MKEMTKEVRCFYDSIFEGRKRAILESEDKLKIKGTTYYVSNEGDDENDGKSSKTPWKSIEKVSLADLHEGDGVLFRRGDLFRGSVMTKSGVTYGAYGKGDKPKFYGCHISLADPSLWELYDEEKNIWKCREKMLDSGTIVFNDGEFHGRKLIPSYRYGKFVSRDNEDVPFDMAKEMTNDLDLYWHFEDELIEGTSKGESFPVPKLTWGESKGDLYLRCDKGNPGEVFSSVESLAGCHIFKVNTNKNVTIDNVCIKYGGLHGVAAAGRVEGLKVTNCEIGWIGGCIQHYSGTDPNYPEGKRGSVTRFGNAIEIYGGCDNYNASYNYIYQVYDAGITHQVTTKTKMTMENINYEGNIIENCVYGIEYFLDMIEGEKESYMENVLIKENFIRLSGYGWGQQRHDKTTPALIKGWSYVNAARKFRITGNIFDSSAYRLLHLVAGKEEYCPVLRGNVYIQNMGGMLGQFGANEEKEPEIEIYDEKAEEKIKEIFGDIWANIYYIK